MTTLVSGARDEAADGPVHQALFLLAGHNVFNKQFFFGPVSGRFTPAAAKAARNAKFFLGYPDDQVMPTFDDVVRGYLLGGRKPTKAMQARRVQRGFAAPVKFLYPSKVRGTLIGLPGQGTHSFIEPPNNWESDNAIDIGLPLGTLLVAVADGVIGTQFGPLSSKDPRFLGLRCHLATADNEFYYAHLSRFADGVQPGSRLKQGQALGFSGAANGVNHLHIACKDGDPVALLTH